jgi:hypothetical protein
MGSFAMAKCDKEKGRHGEFKKIFPSKERAQEWLGFKKITDLEPYPCPFYEHWHLRNTVGRTLHFDNTWMEVWKPKESDVSALEKRLEAVLEELAQEKGRMISLREAREVLWLEQIEDEERR